MHFVVPCLLAYSVMSARAATCGSRQLATSLQYAGHA
jgi:hypothetical protein